MAGLSGLRCGCWTAIGQHEHRRQCDLADVSASRCAGALRAGRLILPKDPAGRRFGGARLDAQRDASARLPQWQADPARERIAMAR